MSRGYFTSRGDIPRSGERLINVSRTLTKISGITMIVTSNRFRGSIFLKQRIPRPNRKEAEGKQDTSSRQRFLLLFLLGLARAREKERERNVVNA